MIDVINGVPRELLERIALPMERDSAYLFQHRDDLDELRALLSTTQPAADGEWEAFEAVYAGRCNFERNPHHPDIYANEPCRARWEAWQARALLATALLATPQPAVDMEVAK